MEVVYTHILYEKCFDSTLTDYLGGATEELKDRCTGHVQNFFTFFCVFQRFFVFVRANFQCW